MVAASGAANAPPAQSPSTTGQLLKPIVTTKVADWTTVTKNSARFTDPIAMRGSWPRPTSVEVTIGPQPPPPIASINPPTNPSASTRLLVTAYIGIGNRLFIRGEGPGLSWDKGVPLQFVSIGKWRWETNDASAPVQFKLFKNDDLECSALGAQSLDPGHQQEITAAF